MADAAIVTLWKFVTDQLNDSARQWPQQFKAERKYNPKERLEDLTSNLVVQVAIATDATEPDNHTDWRDTYDIDIGIMCLADPNEGEEATARFDALMFLVQEVSDYFKLQTSKPTALTDCWLNGVAFGPQGDGNPYVREFIQKNAFVSIIRLNYTINRDPSQ